MDTDSQVLVIAGALVRLERSRFLALPAELRNRVYDYVFAALEDHAIRVVLQADGSESPGVYWLRPDFPPSRTTKYSRPNFLAVRFTCRQIARETSGYWFRKLSLCSCLYDYKTLDPTSGEVSITPYLMSHWKHIKHLELGHWILFGMGTGIDLQERMLPTLQYLGWLEPNRNVTAISIIHFPPWYYSQNRSPSALTMEHFLRLLSSFRGPFPFLAEVRVVSSGPYSCTHRFRLDDAGNMWEWYTKEHLSTVQLSE